MPSGEIVPLRMRRLATCRCLSVLVLALAGATQAGQGNPIDDQPLAADAMLELLLDRSEPRDREFQFGTTDLAAVAAAPAEFRGKSFVLRTGPAIRVSTRAFDVTSLSGWQFSVEGLAEPILLLIHEPAGSTAPSDRVTSIEIGATFWKSAMATMSVRAVDPARPSSGDVLSREAQRILVFVGTEPIYAAVSEGAPIAPWAGLVGVLVVGGGVLMVVRRVARRQSALRAFVDRDAEPDKWNDADLPDEPAEALAELRRRGEDTMSHDPAAERAD